MRSPALLYEAQAAQYSGNPSETRPRLLRVDGCGDNAAESQHRKATILELLQPHLFVRHRVLRKELLAEEEVARLAHNAILSDRLLVAFLGEPKPIDLQDRDRAKEGRHDPCFDHCVVRIDRGNALELLAWEANTKVRSDPADHREHAHTGVLQLSLANEVHRQ